MCSSDLKLSGLSAVFENKEAFRKRKAEELGHEKAEAWYKYIKRQIQEPWSGFRAEVMNKLDQVFVSRPPRKNATGAAHKDTIFSNNKNKGSLPIRNGMAEKENMFRLDVFQKEGRLYIVPIYVVDLVSGKQFVDAPQPNEYSDDCLVTINADFNFKFSLYKDDYVEINSGDEHIKGYVNQYNAQSGQLYIGSTDNSRLYKIKTSTFEQGDHIILEINGEERIGEIGAFDAENQKIIIEGMGISYAIDGVVKVNKKGEATKNIKTSQGYVKLSAEKKISLNVIERLRKYQVDPLGRIVEVKKETRLPLIMMKKKPHPKSKTGE